MTTTGAATDTATPPTADGNGHIGGQPDHRREAQLGQPSADSPQRQDSPAARLFAFPHRLYAAAQSEALLLTVLASSFLIRWLLADRTSYWNDEFLSVHVYGNWHDSVSSAIDHLASSSIHPPVYQFILYEWMEIFGDTERATRSLSNLYITLATLFLFLLVRDAFGRRIALASAITFALMYTPMYYAMETRSYAQTIFLVTLSSYLLLRLMRRGSTDGWRAALLSPSALAFTLANAALLLTHYYNAFFWVAQGTVAAVFVLREIRPKRWLVGLGAVVGLYALQGAIFALTWGQVLADDYRRRGGAFPAEGGVRSPTELLRTVVTQNIDPPRMVMWLLVAAGAIVAIRTLISLVRGTRLSPERLRGWTVGYLIAWLLLPLVVVYVAFLVTGVARYSSRYWLFILPPLAPLLILTIRQVIRLAVGIAERLGSIRVPPQWWAVPAIAAVAALVIPGTLAAATANKHDWRGTAQQVVDLVETDSDSDYIIYETSHRRESMANYYFERFSRDVEVYGTVRRSEELRGEFRILGVDQPVIAEHDYLVLIFTHQRTKHFPTALAELEERYEVRHQQLNHMGRGFIVFDVRSSSNDQDPT